MTPRRLTRTLPGLAACGLLIAFAGSVPSPAAHAAQDDLDCGASLVKKTMENGSSWRMCARIHPVKGLVLEKVEFRPASGDHEYAGYKRVLDQIYLAQLNVAYDSGIANYNDMTSYGFGNQYLVEQVPELCPGATLDVTQPVIYQGQYVERTIPGICVDEIPAGVATHSQENQNLGSLRFVDQSTALQVSSVSKISWYEYQQKVTFGDHGQIEVGLGATGDLAPADAFYPTDPTRGWPIGSSQDDPQRYAASHRHNAIYRVDFGIDSGAEQDVEQWDYATDDQFTTNLRGTGTRKDAAFSAVPGTGSDELTWWRVLNPASLNNDGHARSYEIVNQNHPDAYSAVTQPIVSFTNDHACQEFASENLNPDCPNQSLLDYVANETAPLTDPVAWVNVGFHHVVRDEDQSPMPMHWQSFQLVPRDFFAQSPSTTEARRCINGPQTGSTVSDRPCIATNIGRPLVTANTAGLRPGTKLTTTPGSWNTSRTTWNYSYMWFRNGEPIVDVGTDGEPVPAIASSYVLTDADVGTTLTVKVTASQTGFGSGTAESPPITVPGRPASPPTTPAGPTATKPALDSLPSSVWGSLATSHVTVTQNPRLRVTVAAGGTAARGRFEVRHGSKVLKTGYVKDGRARITLPKLTKARTYRLRVVYLGSRTVKPSTSKLITLRVTRR